MKVYRGGRRQRGYGIGGLFSSFFRKASPFLKNSALSAGRNALNLANNVIEDVERGGNVLKSLKKHGEKAAMKTAQEVGFNALKRGADVFDDIWSQDAKRSRVSSDEEDS